MIVWIRKNYWRSYLLFLLSIFILYRLFSKGKTTVIEEFTDIYMENTFLGGYTLFFLLMLVPIFKEILNGYIIVKWENRWNYTLHIIKIIAKRAVSYSFCLTIVFYLLNCSRCGDWLERGNVIRICLLFLTQSIGWMVIAMLNFAIYMFVKKEILAFLIAYFYMIILNLSLYVNWFEQLEYYLRMYYLMFHIEIFPTMLTFISVTSLYAIILIGLCMLIYYKIEKHQYI